MNVKPIQIGDVTLENNIFLAPMAGYTDYGFRHLQIELGIGLTFTELISAKGIAYGGINNAQLCYSGEDTGKTAAQIFGAEEYFMRKAIESEYLKDYQIIDINMGCPVPKVFKNGEGSALLKDILKAEKIIKECVKTGKNITVKIRTGQNAGDDVATDFALMAEQAGAKAITIHGRVRQAYYSGEPDFNAIARAKQAVNIPVIANGGIFTKQDATAMIDKTGADGVMIARGAIDNPYLVCEILGKEHQKNIKKYMLSHIDLMQKVYPASKANVEFRKFVSCYLKGRTGVKDLKLCLQTAPNLQTLINLIQNNL